MQQLFGSSRNKSRLIDNQIKISVKMPRHATAEAVTNIASLQHIATKQVFIYTSTYHSKCSYFTTSKYNNDTFESSYSM